jgi:sugar phosphate isomerase/epimerase
MIYSLGRQFFTLPPPRPTRDEDRQRRVASLLETVYSIRLAVKYRTKLQSLAAATAGEIAADGRLQIRGRNTMSGGVDLIASYWTIAGKLNFSDGMDLDGSPIDFPLRVEAAARAGYSGLGLTHPDLRKTLARHGYEGISSILRANGIKHFEVEFLVDWFMSGERRRRSDLIRRDLLTAAEKIGARHIKVGGDMEGKSWPLDDMIRSFGDLCDEAKNAGTNIVIEILPWSNIADLETGKQIVSAADRSNGALLIDVWHMGRGGISYDEVASTPRRMVGYVELSDAAPKAIGRLIEDTVHHRKLCGEGSLDVPGFLRSIKATGYDGPFGIEIISDEHRERPLTEAATRSFNTAMAQFAGIYGQ